MVYIVIQGNQVICVKYCLIKSILNQKFRIYGLIIFEKNGIIIIL